MVQLWTFKLNFLFWKIMKLEMEKKNKLFLPMIIMIVSKIHFSHRLMAVSASPITSCRN